MMSSGLVHARHGDARVLNAGFPHGARLELGDYRRVKPPMAFRARRLVEHAVRDVGAELRRGRRHGLEIRVDCLCLGIAHDTGVERRHDPARRA
jgi:hypothetical protein